MKKGIIVNLKRFKLLDYVNLNKVFFLLSALYILGILFGSFWLNKNTWLSGITQHLFENFVHIHNKSNLIQVIFSCFFQYFIILILYFLSGTSMLGVVLTPFFIVWQGIFSGNIVFYLYSHYGLSGIAFNTVIFIPPLSIFIVSCFFAARYSINFSIDIARLTLPKCRPANLYTAFKDYCIKYLIFIIVALFCSLFDYILNLLFLNFFNF